MSEISVRLGIIEPKEGKINRSNVFHVSHRSTEKAALLSPDDDVQKSDVSSSSQGLVEKEALGPMLLEVPSIPHVDLFNHHLSNRSSSTLLNTNLPPTPHPHPPYRPWMDFSLLSTERAALFLFPRM